MKIWLEAQFSELPNNTLEFLIPEKSHKDWAGVVIVERNAIYGYATVRQAGDARFLILSMDNALDKNPSSYEERQLGNQFTNFVAALHWKIP